MRAWSVQTDRAHQRFSKGTLPALPLHSPGNPRPPSCAWVQILQDRCRLPTPAPQHWTTTVKVCPSFLASFLPSLPGSSGRELPGSAHNKEAGRGGCRGRGRDKLQLQLQLRRPRSPAPPPAPAPGPASQCACAQPDPADGGGGQEEEGGRGRMPGSCTPTHSRRPHAACTREGPYERGPKPTVCALPPPTRGPTASGPARRPPAGLLPARGGGGGGRRSPKAPPPETLQLTASRRGRCC